MINFKKNTIFSRNTKEEPIKEDILHGGVLAVWGSPASGKTTVAVKLAKYLAEKGHHVYATMRNTNSSNKEAAENLKKCADVFVLRYGKILTN